MKFFASILSALALAVMATPLPSQAQPAISAEEAADLALVDRAFQAFGRSGYEAIDPMLPELRAAFDRAPESQASFEVGPDYVIIRPLGDESQALAMTILAGAMAGELTGQDSGQTIAIVQREPVYTWLALLLASEAVERGRYEDAVGYTGRGLERQPDAAPLVLEHAIALLALDRDAEALAVVDGALGAGITTQSYRPALLRRRGGILIELNRLAEAREALTESLELEPGHPTALHELQVIEAAEAGQGIGEFEIIRPAAAEQATGD
jgi:tetratricopeptide (TPR) repeat protein